MVEVGLRLLGVGLRYFSASFNAPTSIRDGSGSRVRIKVRGRVSRRKS